jgi:hypothetical protein
MGKRKKMQQNSDLFKLPCFFPAAEIYLQSTIIQLVAEILRTRPGGAGTGEIA